MYLVSKRRRLILDAESTRSINMDKYYKMIQSKHISKILQFY